MESATDIKADINKTYRCVSETQVNMDNVTVTLRDAAIQAYLSSSNFSREGEDPAEAPAPTVGKVPSSLRVGSSRVQGKAGGPSAFFMEWMGSGWRSPHRGLAHHSPAQAGGPGVPLRTSSSCEVRVLASRESWGPRSLQRVPWAPHSMLSSAADSPHPAAQLTGHHHCLGGGWHPPTLLRVPALPGGSEWPGSGLHGNPVALPMAGSRPGPSCFQWGCEAFCALHSQ